MTDALLREMFDIRLFQGPLNLSTLAWVNNVPRHVVAEYIEARPEFVERQAKRRMKLVDLAEDVLQKKLKKKKKWALKFVHPAPEPERPASEPKRLVPNNIPKPAPTPPERHRNPDPTEPPNNSSYMRPLPPTPPPNHRALEIQSWKMRFAAGRLGMGAGGFLNYMTLRARPRSEAADKREELLDEAETNLCEDILAGKPSAIRFTLRTLGRDRGYEPAPPPTRRNLGPPRPKKKPDFFLDPIQSNFINNTQNQEERERLAFDIDERLRKRLEKREGWLVEFLLSSFGQARGYVQAKRKRRSRAATNQNQAQQGQMPEAIAASRTTPAVGTAATPGPEAPRGAGRETSEQADP